MNKKKMVAALKAKGIHVDALTYSWQGTPHGAEPGWIIQLTPESDEELVARGYDTEPDCANAVEVMEWIATLPDLNEPAEFVRIESRPPKRLRPRKQAP